MTAAALGAPALELTWRAPRSRRRRSPRRPGAAAPLLHCLWAAGWLMPYGAPLVASYGCSHVSSPATATSSGSAS